MSRTQPPTRYAPYPASLSRYSTLSAFSLMPALEMVCCDRVITRGLLMAGSLETLFLNCFQQLVHSRKTRIIAEIRRPAYSCPAPFSCLLPSSSGLGHRPLTAGTGVRFP